MGLGGDRQEMQNWGGGKGGINIFLQNGILNFKPEGPEGRWGRTVEKMKNKAVSI